jgi:hypothetical protein
LHGKTQYQTHKTHSIPLPTNRQTTAQTCCLFLNINHINYYQQRRRHVNTAAVVLPGPLRWTRRLGEPQGLPGRPRRVPSQTQGTSRGQHHPPGLRGLHGLQDQHLAAIGRTRGLGRRRLPAPRGRIHGQAQIHRRDLSSRDAGNHLPVYVRRYKKLTSSTTTTTGNDGSIQQQQQQQQRQRQQREAQCFLCGSISSSGATRSSCVRDLGSAQPPKRTLLPTTSNEIYLVDNY